MSKKYDIMDVDENKTKSLAEVMKNKTCKKILNYLREEGETSETKISKELKIPLSTIHYNLKKLKESGLVNPTSFQWSPKGNKVYNYAPSDKTFVFSQKKSEGFETKLKVIFPLMVVVAVIIALNIAYFPKDDTTDSIIPTFSSCNDLRKAFEESSKHQPDIRVTTAGSGSLFSGTIQAFETSGDSSSTNSVEYSETNIQVEGVDEADIVKTDGKYIYLVTGSKLVIAKAYPSDSAEITSETPLDYFDPSEILIYNNKLLIFGSSKGESSLRLFDAENKEKPKLIKSFDFEGDYITSRKIDSYVYFVITTSPDLRGTSPVPMYE